MTISGLLGIVGGIFGVLSLVAGAAVYLRASYAKARIDALNAEIEEEKRRSSQLRLDVTQLEAQNKVLDAKVAALNELVTQRAQLDMLRENMTEMRRQVDTLMGVVNRVLEKVSGR